MVGNKVTDNAGRKTPYKTIYLQLNLGATVLLDEKRILEREEQ
jgi:hypothetical protein